MGRYSLCVPPEGDLRWRAPRPLIAPESVIQPQEGMVVTRSEYLCRH